MHRKINFRSWLIEKQKMLFDFCMNVPTISHQRNCVLMQYTGLNSTKGDQPEMYEGDIVRGINYGANNPHEFIGVIKYEYNQFVVRGVGENKSLVVDVNVTFEVLGNVYQHPHLLEVAE